MVKVLLVLDDYNEQVYLQSTLKKLGFDIEVTNKTSMIASQILIFRPQVIVAAQSKKINGYQASKEIKKKNPEIPFVLVIRGNQKIFEKLEASGEIEACVESPVVISKLIHAMRKVVNFNVDLAIEKLNKLNSMNKGESDNIRVSGSSENQGSSMSIIKGGESGDSSVERISGQPIHQDIKDNVSRFSKEQFEKFNHCQFSKEERQEKYSNFLNESQLDGKVIAQSKFSREKIREFTKMIREVDSVDDGGEELKDQKRNFVKKLFTINKK